MKNENKKTPETTFSITRFSKGNIENEFPERTYVKLQIIGSMMLICDKINDDDGPNSSDAKHLVSILQNVRASGLDEESFNDPVMGRVLGIIFRIISDSVKSCLYTGGEHAFHNASLNRIQDAIKNNENLTEEIKKDAFFEGKSNVAILSNIIEGTKTSAYCEAYINDLKRIAFHERYKSAMVRIGGLSDPKREPQATIQDAVRILEELQRGFTDTSSPTLASGMDAAYDELSSLIRNGPEALGNIMSGIAPLDKLLGGFRKSEYVVIAARPSVGKTALAMQILKNAALQGKTYFSSLEMSSKEICRRYLLAEMNISLSALNAGFLVADQRTEHLKRLETAKDACKQFDENIIFPKAGITDIDEICANVRWEHLRNKISLFVIDYMQLANSSEHSQARHLEVADISRKLKLLATTLDIPVIALSQLNRESEDSRNDDSEPKLSQIRESGAIEQDADVVLLLHRSKKITEELRNKPYPVAINIAKVRNGGGGKISLTFTPQTTTFSEPTATSPTQSQPEGSGRFTPPAGLFH